LSVSVFANRRNINFPVNEFLLFAVRICQCQQKLRRMSFPLSTSNLPENG